MTDVLFSSDKMTWCTPQKFFDKLNEEFHFTLDPASTDKSAKCKKHFTPKEDGLAQSWEGYTVFCNPPYGREIGKWVKKTYTESLKPNTTVVMLIPARTDTQYFHDYILHGKAKEIRFLKGRLKFTDEDGREKDAAPFPSAVIIWSNMEEHNDT